MAYKGAHPCCTEHSFRPTDTGEYLKDLKVPKLDAVRCLSWPQDKFCDVHRLTVDADYYPGVIARNQLCPLWFDYLCEEVIKAWSGSSLTVVTWS